MRRRIATSPRALAGNKFVIPYARALDAYRRAAGLPHLRVVGIDCHIGSQILETAPLDAALERVMELVVQVQAEGIRIGHVDLGGGFGIRYRDETPPDLRAWCLRLAQRFAGGPPEVLRKPGAASSARRVLLTAPSTQCRHAKLFAGRRRLDIALIRPALTSLALHRAGRDSGADAARYDVRPGVRTPRSGEDAISPSARQPSPLSAGAYAMAMASNYNARRGCE